jgi:pimeloyl-ACP methyl ester carboxylesterase
MAEWLGRAVDWLNASLVGLRVGRRPAPVDPAALRRLAARRDDPLADGGVMLAPTRVGERRGRESWQDTAAGWAATRLPAEHPTGHAVIILHGWLAIGLQMAALRQFAHPLQDAGMDIWFPWLPLHGPRTPRGAISGETLASGDLAATTEALILGVRETAGLVEWLRARHQTVSIVGISLGGWVAALTATMAPDIARVVLWTPVADPAATLFSSPLLAGLRRGLVAAGLDQHAAAEALGALTPTARPLAVAAKDVLVLGARQDNVVPVSSLEALEAAWGNRTEWLPTGHITAQWSPRGRRLARTWVRSR